MDGSNEIQRKQKRNNVLLFMGRALEKGEVTLSELSDFLKERLSADECVQLSTELQNSLLEKYNTLTSSELDNSKD